MVERVFRYLIGTRDLSIMEAFTDASFADCKGSLTTCGYLIRLFGDPIAWRSHKQSYVALSTCQAEYVAMSEACQEIIALCKTIENIFNRGFYPVLLHCDNKAAVATAETTGGIKLRHMTEVGEDYVKECTNRKFIDLSWVRSKDPLADIFTKPLSFEIFAKLTKTVMNN